MPAPMTREEREAFLAGVHVGVLSIDEPGRGPLSVPVWYLYESGGEIVLVTRPEARKARLAVTCDLCESLPGNKGPMCVYACPHDSAKRPSAEQFWDTTDGVAQEAVPAGPTNGWRQAFRWLSWRAR